MHREPHAVTRVSLARTRATRRPRAFVHAWIHARTHSDTCVMSRRDFTHPRGKRDESVAADERSARDRFDASPLETRGAAVKQIHPYNWQIDRLIQSASMLLRPQLHSAHRASRRRKRPRSCVSAVVPISSPRRIPREQVLEISLVSVCTLLSRRTHSRYLHFTSPRVIWPNLISPCCTGKKRGYVSPRERAEATLHSAIIEASRPRDGAR